MNKNEIEEIKRIYEHYKLGALKPQDIRLDNSVYFIVLKTFNSEKKTTDHLTYLKVLPIQFDTFKVSYTNLLNSKTYNYELNSSPFEEIITELIDDLMKQGNPSQDYTHYSCGCFARTAFFNYLYQMPIMHNWQNIYQTFNWKSFDNLNSSINLSPSVLSKECREIEACILADMLNVEKLNSNQNAKTANDTEIKKVLQGINQKINSTGELHR